jgi:hypothetical protein
MSFRKFSNVLVPSFILIVIAAAWILYLSTWNNLSVNFSSPVTGSGSSTNPSTETVTMNMTEETEQLQAYLHWKHNNEPGGVISRPLTASEQMQNYLQWKHHLTDTPGVNNTAEQKRLIEYLAWKHNFGELAPVQANDAAVMEYIQWVHLREG